MTPAAGASHRGAWPLRRALLAFALGAACLPAAQANTTATTPPPEVLAWQSDARLQGSGRLRFLGLHIYDARLWVGPAFDPARFSDQPLALELEYARTLYGAKVAERTLEEMRKQGEVAAADAQAWLAAMVRLFPDVSAGDRLTGIQQPGTGANFFINGKPLGEIRDARFARRFFAIWLSARSSEPDLRRALIGNP